MMWCPICMKPYALTNTSDTECPDCMKDFEAKRWKFKLPKNLKQEPTCFYEYKKMGKVFERLRLGYLTPEAYEREMAQVADEINLQVELTTGQQTELQISKSYAESLLLH